MPICAGDIISEYDILTNAICASACQYPPNCKLYVGRVHVNLGGKEMTIKGTVWHGSCYEMEMLKEITLDEMFRRYDIGIIHTEMIPTSTTVRTIVPELCESYEDGIDVFFAGWGADSNAAFEIQSKVNKISSSWLFAS